MKVFTKLGEAFLRLTSEADMRRDLYKDDLVDKAKQLWVEFLAKESGVGLERLTEKRPRQSFHLRAFYEHLKLIGDPDADAFSGAENTFQTGVPYRSGRHAQSAGSVRGQGEMEEVRHGPMADR